MQYNPNIKTTNLLTLFLICYKPWEYYHKVFFEK